MNELIRAQGLGFLYSSERGDAIRALVDIDLSIARGEYLAVVGHNGSGKSTLAKCLSGLFLPTEGDVWVAGINTRQSDQSKAIRAKVGVVFQHPDNQFVASQVEDEVAFGPENLGLPEDLLNERVTSALTQTRLSHLRFRNPSTLSGGEKALLAMAGILAMGPDCLVLDESTALLDPSARDRVLSLLQELRAKGMAVVLITHQMDEVVDADRIVVLDAGRIALQGVPRQVFSEPDLLLQLGLELPTAAAIARGLVKRGAVLEKQPLTAAELVKAILDEVGRGI